MFLQILYVLAFTGGRERRWRCTVVGPCQRCQPIGFRNNYVRTSDVGTNFPPGVTCFNCIGQSSSDWCDHLHGAVNTQCVIQSARIAITVLPVNLSPNSSVCTAVFRFVGVAPSVSGLLATIASPRGGGWYYEHCEHSDDGGVIWRSSGHVHYCDLSVQAPKPPQTRMKPVENEEKTGNSNKKALAVRSDEENLKNLTSVTWAHAVNNKTYLEAALASDVHMIEADIVLGTLIGKEDSALPVMAHPPATTSDLSLGDFLARVAEHNKRIPKDKQKGVKLDFKSDDAFHKAQEIIAPYSKPEVTFPLWLNADILPGPVEAIPPPIPLNPEKFIKLASRHPRAVLSIGWTTQYGGNITEGEYTRQQIGTMLRIVNTLKVNQTVTFPVRAGLASNSQPVLLDLLRETRALRSSITVWSAEEDAVSVPRLRALILTVGLEHTYLDVPPALASTLNLGSASSKH